MAEDQRAGMFGRSPHSSEASPATYCGGGSSMTRSYAGGSSSAASPMDQTHPVLMRSYGTPPRQWPERPTDERFTMLGELDEASEQETFGRRRRPGQQKNTGSVLAMAQAGSGSPSGLATSMSVNDVVRCGPWTSTRRAPLALGLPRVGPQGCPCCRLADTSLPHHARLESRVAGSKGQLEQRRRGHARDLVVQLWRRERGRLQEALARLAGAAATAARWRFCVP